jgi:hypothetical protein
VLTGKRIERSQVGAPGEFDNVDGDELEGAIIERFAGLGFAPELAITDGSVALNDTATDTEGSCIGRGGRHFNAGQVPSAPRGPSCAFLIWVSPASVTPRPRTWRIEVDRWNDAPRISFRLKLF